MRTMPTYFADKVAKPIQAAATDAAPSTELWISRPTTALVNTEFLEKQKVLQGSNITDVAIAACHPIVNKPVSKIYKGAVDNGVAKVYSSLSREVMAQHVWVNTGFSETATAIALEFDGTMPKDGKGRVEFVTELQPWVFWVNGGALYGRLLGTTSTVTLATANVTDVFAVRGTHSDVGGFDFGLIVFFIVAGSIYYRQLIDGEWYDAAPISFGPTGPFTRIAAMRTWDYRVMLQAWDTSGVLHEMFSQYQGIGKQNVEHIEITNVDAKGEIIPIKYHDTSECEHVEISTVTADGKLRRNISPAPSAVANVNDGTGNWATLVQVALDNPCDAESVIDNYTAFSLVGGSTTYACSAASCSADGLVITLTFATFASGSLTLSYTPGTITSPDLDMAAWLFVFTPTNLTKPDGYDLEHIEISNITATGTLTKINYRNTSNSENIQISNITATGTLTHVDDI